jgi:hypothetical protein
MCGSLHSSSPTYGRLTLAAGIAILWVAWKRTPPARSK